MPSVKPTTKATSKSPSKSRAKVKAPIPSPPKTRSGGRSKSAQVTPPRKGALKDKVKKAPPSLSAGRNPNGEGHKATAKGKPIAIKRTTKAKSPARKHVLEKSSSVDTAEAKHSKSQKKRLIIAESEDSEDNKGSGDELIDTTPISATAGKSTATEITQEKEDHDEDDTDSLDEELNLISKRTNNRKYRTVHAKAMKGESWSDDEEDDELSEDREKLNELQAKRRIRTAKLAKEQEERQYIELSSGPSSSCASTSSEEEDSSDDEDSESDGEGSDTSGQKDNEATVPTTDKNKQDKKQKTQKNKKGADEDEGDEGNHGHAATEASNKGTKEANPEEEGEEEEGEEDDEEATGDQEEADKEAASEDQDDEDTAGKQGEDVNDDEGDDDGQRETQQATTSTSDGNDSKKHTAESTEGDTRTAAKPSAARRHPNPYAKKSTSPVKGKRLAPNGGKGTRRSPRLNEEADTEPTTKEHSPTSSPSKKKSSADTSPAAPKESYAKKARRPPLQSALKKSTARFHDQPVDSSGVDDRIALQARRVRATICTEHPDCQPEMMRMILVQLAGIYGHIRTCMKSTNLQRKKKKYLWVRPFNDTTEPDYYNRKDKGWIDEISSKMNFSDFNKYFQGAFYMNTRPRSGKWYFRFTIVLPKEEDIADLVKNVTFNLPNSHERLQDLTTSQEIYDPFRVSFLHRSNRQLAYDTDFVDRVNDRMHAGVKVGFSWTCISKTAPGEMWNAKKAIYAIVVECNEHQVEPATHQLKRLFPLVRPEGFVPILGCHLSFGYLDTHPHIKNNHVAVCAISKLISRQKVHTDNEVLLSTTAILPGSLYLPIPGTDHTLQSLLMSTRSTITEEGIGGQIFHTCTYNNQNGAHTCNFTTHKIYETEASSIVSAIGVFLRDEMQLTGLEDYIAVHSINEDDTWHVGTRCVDNEASRWLEQQMDLTEDLDAPAVEAQESPAVTAAYTPQEIREFQRQAGLRDEETVVNWTQARRSAQPMTPQQAANLNQAVQQLPPPQLVSQTSDAASVASTIGNQSTTGFSAAKSTASGKSMTSRAGRELVMQQCQDLIEEQQQKTEALMNDKFAQMMQMLSAAVPQPTGPSKSATGGSPGGNNV